MASATEIMLLVVRNRFEQLKTIKIQYGNDNEINIRIDELAFILSEIDKNIKKCDDFNTN